MSKKCNNCGNWLFESDLKCIFCGSETKSGRSKTGRLRNFKAMDDSKLISIFNCIKIERNDEEALDAIELEVLLRSDKIR